MTIANSNIADPTRYASIQQYLNLDSLIDYMLVNFYVGNTDWDGHNWRAARKRETGAGYLMLPWDSEFANLSEWGRSDQQSATHFQRAHY